MHLLQLHVCTDPVADIVTGHIGPNAANHQCSIRSSIIGAVLEHPIDGTIFECTIGRAVLRAVIERPKLSTDHQHSV